MSTRTSTSDVYLHVVDDVTTKMRQALDAAGDDSALSHLQALWELKMVQSGVVQGPLEVNSSPNGVPTPVHDLNVPYEGTEEYQTPTADILFPPTPLQTPIQTPLAADPRQSQHSPAGRGGDRIEADEGAAGKTGTPAPYMLLPSPWMKQRPLGVDVNVAYTETQEEGGLSESQPPTKDSCLQSAKRKREEHPAKLPKGKIPQQDGSADKFLEGSVHQKVSSMKNLSNDAHAETSQQWPDASFSTLVNATQEDALVDPLKDGSGYFYDDIFCTEDSNAPSSHDMLPVTVAETPKPPETQSDADDESLSNEDYDDELYSPEQAEVFSIPDLVLAQFEKVTRVKSKWKCILKSGIMRINDKDVLFRTANGEFNF